MSLRVVDFELVFYDSLMGYWNCSDGMAFFDGILELF
jgi:hypothetical protein